MQRKKTQIKPLGMGLSDDPDFYVPVHESKRSTQKTRKKKPAPVTSRPLPLIDEEKESDFSYATPLFDEEKNSDFSRSSSTLFREKDSKETPQIKIISPELKKNAEQIEKDLITKLETGINLDALNYKTIQERKDAELALKLQLEEYQDYLRRKL